MDEMILVDGKRIKCPSKFKWKKSDISAKNAGRTNDTKMHKNRVGEKRTLGLGWINLSKQEIQEVLSAFDPEYVTVQYWDPKAGYDVAKVFYTGDMEADVGWWRKGRERYSTLGFDIVEQ